MIFQYRWGNLGKFFLEHVVVELSVYYGAMLLRTLLFLALFATGALGVFFPLNVSAQTAASTNLSAGFATTPLWISSASPVNGDALKLFAVVTDTSTTTVSGAVSFLVDGTVVGSVVDVSLTAGTAQIVSTAWTAVVGTHVITVTFDHPEDANGQSVSLFKAVVGPLSVTVAEAPPAPLAVQYLNTAMNVGGSVLSGTLAVVDSARQSGADYFAKQLGVGATSTARPQAQVLGTTTEKLANAGVAAITAATPPSSLFDRLGYLFFENPLIFYPLLLLFLFVTLWLIPSTFSRR